MTIYPCKGKINKFQDTDIHGFPCYLNFWILGCNTHGESWYVDSHKEAVEMLQKHHRESSEYLNRRLRVVE